jgi:predicted DNA-binding transcriptional regulator AlpA
MSNSASTSEPAQSTTSPPPAAAAGRRKRIADVPSEKKFLTFNEIVLTLNIGARTLRRALSSGRFPKADIRMGRLQRWTPAAFEAGVASLKGVNNGN